MKITVYAICKNAEEFIEGFCENIFEADEVVILDTGSIDNSVQLLKDKGVKVYEKKYDFFRFDVARNDCLALVSDDTDLCLSIDMDEYIEKDWRKKLEEIYEPSICNYFYKNNYKINENGHVELSLYVGKIHTKQNFYWAYPVHEILKYTGNCFKDLLTAIEVKHYPKLEERNYMPLLELSVKENPNDERPLYFLAREYYFLNQDKNAIEFFKKYLKLTTDSLDSIHFRSLINIYLAKIKQRNNEDPLPYALRAVAECPFYREAWFWLAKSWALHQNWKSVEAACINVLSLTNPFMSLEQEGQVWDNNIIYEMLEESYKQSSKSIQSSIAIQGWMSIEELNILKMLSKNMTSIAEIGCWKGKSTKIFLSECLGTVYAIDHFKGSEDDSTYRKTNEDSDSLYNQFRSNIGYAPNLRILKTSSEEAAKLINEEIDMVFIDGQHTFESVKQDIELWLPKTKKIICGHDYHLPEVKQAVNSIFKNIEVVDTIWIYRKS